MPPTPFDITRLNAIDLSLADVDSPLKKLRQSAFGAQLAQVEAIEKALGVSAQASKALRQDIATADKERLASEEKADRLSQELTLATSARLAAETEVLNKDAEVKKQLGSAGAQLAKLRGELDDARIKLDAKQRPKLAVQDVLAALGHQLSTINTATPSASQPFAGQFVVDRLDVELKGGINIDSGFAVVPPQGDELTPENASTVRFSIRPATTVRALDEE